MATLFCGSAVLGLYFHGAATDAFSRPRLFTLQTKGLHKLTFFLIVVLAATVNVRLANIDCRGSVTYARRRPGALLALRRILWLHMWHKLVEDLPQLVLAGIFLSSQRHSAGADGDRAAVSASVRSSPSRVPRSLSPSSGSASRASTAS